MSDAVDETLLLTGHEPILLASDQESGCSRGVVQGTPLKI